MSSERGWESAPCGLAVLRLDGTVVEANATLRGWLGGDVAPGSGFHEALSVGGRIYWETHLSPLLNVERRLDEVALELRGRIPVLLSAVVTEDGLVQVAVSSASERIRFERELVIARRQAEQAFAQVDALQAVTAALSGAVGYDELVDALLEAAVVTLGAASATVGVLEAGALVMARGRGEEPQLLPLRKMSSAATVVDGRFVVPLQGHAAVRGLLLFAEDAGGDGSLHDLDLLTAVGQQAGLALDRAQHFEQQASTARVLQHSLLAVAPPQDERYDVATAYRPGVEALEVGGDWYDVFLADPDQPVLSIVVGDVVGRGLAAASAMGQLRSAIRAVAGVGLGPAAVLSRLDRFVDLVEAAAMATVAYAELDLATGVLRYACAGHPPPVLLRGPGEGSVVWDGRSTPLGAYDHPIERSQAQRQLAPGDRVLLYTDGLVERRDRAIDDGIELLRATAASVQGSLRDQVGALTGSMLSDEQGRDDVCVLLLSWLGPRLEVSVELSGLSDVRRELSTWLASCGAAPELAEDLVLAASEAAANAVEHGAADPVVLRAWLEAGRDEGCDVVLAVRDEGAWRPSQGGEERGRGMTIMAALVDDVQIDTSQGTTVRLRRRLYGRSA